MPKMTAKQQEKALRFAEANLRFEGFVVSAEVKQNARRMLNGEVTGDELVAKYLAEAKKE